MPRRAEADAQLRARWVYHREAMRGSVLLLLSLAAGAPACATQDVPAAGRAPSPSSSSTGTETPTAETTPGATATVTGPTTTDGAADAADEGTPCDGEICRAPEVCCTVYTGRARRRRCGVPGTRSRNEGYERRAEPSNVVELCPGR